MIRFESIENVFPYIWCLFVFIKKVKLTRLYLINFLYFRWWSYYFITLYLIFLYPLIQV